MGLLDGLLGGALGGLQGGNGPLGGILSSLGGGQQGNALLQLAMQLVQQQGGLQGLVGKLQQAGLGQEAASWVSTGGNLPVNAEQLQAALGGDVLSGLAAKAGLPAGQAASGLSRLLPDLVNQMTPGGQVHPGTDDMLSQALEALTGGR